ncbi:RagB/SusD family nutrient uptake outer membrane protein [termite gut metagenome]|uniref:RagB/SusD family nutrient uptake outer membrane protein n=1 Tax=termite gut metagenome TaxID=433724 RepID=A0A5J4SWU9_9ZZZZ
MNRFKLYISIIIIVLSLHACESFEDIPLNLATEDYMWDENDATGEIASKWVTDMYSQLPAGYVRLNSMPLECVSDDAVPSNTGNASWNVIRGGYSPMATFDDNWTNAYSQFRRANIFLANYKRIPFSDPSLPKYLEAEVRTIRAYYYFELIKRYGGVPIIGDKAFEATDPELLSLKRNTFEECVNYIVSELDAVTDNLRPEAPLSSRGSGNTTTDGEDNFAGRIRPTIAMAIKAKTLLYAASPLFNEKPIGGGQNSLVGYTTYDKSRWEKAMLAAKKIIDLQLFELEADRYIFCTTRVNREIIWMRMGIKSPQLNYPRYMSPVGYFTDGTNRGQGYVSPTQELVDAFPMADGSKFDWDNSVHAANPYANRDPRLDQTIFYNGARWLRRAVETFENGQDKPNNTALIPNQTLTSYYAKKFLANDAEKTACTAVHYHPSVQAPWSVIRYSDMLLMYAEAQNEFSGPTPEAIEYVRMIRARAGIQKGVTGKEYGIPDNINQADFRQLIRDERRVEFAFEEQRYWDIRRWKIVENTYGKPLHGLTITKESSGVLTYTKKEIVTPYFSEAMYLYPIALKETQVNPNMEQNPNY